MTLQTIAQLIMLATLILMITGRTPIYMTAITGAAISAIVAGFPLAGGQGDCRHDRHSALHRHYAGHGFP